MATTHTIQEVILVDSHDNAIGTMEKLEAHEKGLLHRAFSVFIFNDQGEMLLQKRADTKYHSAGLWSNSCCSHPIPNETIEDAAQRRLMEELSLKATAQNIFSFEYKVELENQLLENELDHVLIGFSNEFGTIHPEEVSELKFVSVQDVFHDVKLNPENYTVWFKIILFEHWEKISSILDKKLKKA